MYALAELTLDKAAFLDWVERQDGVRHELVQGRIVQQQAGGTFDHSRIASRIMILIGSRTDLSAWAVLTGDLAIDVDDMSFRFPEVSVVRLPIDGKARSTNQPVVLVEVASKSSMATDFGAKANEYLALASLEAYVIASQDAAVVWLWTRDAARVFPAEPVVLDRDDAALAIPAIGFACTIAEIYDGIL